MNDGCVVTSQHTNDWEFDAILDLMYCAGKRDRVYRALWICACGFKRRHEMYEENQAKGSVGELEARNIEWNAFMRHKYGDNFETDESARLEKLWAESFVQDAWRRHAARFDWWLIISINITMAVYVVFALAMK